MRERALRNMLDDLSLPGLTVPDLKAKIKTVRTRYIAELAKIRTSERSGAGYGDIYRPRLFWFNTADAFLRVVSTPRQSSSNLGVSDQK